MYKSDSDGVIDGQRGEHTDARRGAPAIDAQLFVPEKCVVEEQTSALQMEPRGRPHREDAGSERSRGRRTPAFISRAVTPLAAPPGWREGTLLRSGRPLPCSPHSQTGPHPSPSSCACVVGPSQRPVSGGPATRSGLRTTLGVRWPR